MRGDSGDKGQTVCTQVGCPVGGFGALTLFALRVFGSTPTVTVCHDDMIRFEGRNARRSAVGPVLVSGRNVLLILAVASGPLTIVGQLQLYSGPMIIRKTLTVHA